MSKTSSPSIMPSGPSTTEAATAAAAAASLSRSSRYSGMGRIIRVLVSSSSSSSSWFWTALLLLFLFSSTTLLVRQHHHHHHHRPQSFLKKNQRLDDFSKINQCRSTTTATTTTLGWVPSLSLGISFAEAVTVEDSQDVEDDDDEYDDDHKHNNVKRSLSVNSQNEDENNSNKDDDDDSEDDKGDDDKSSHSGDGPTKTKTTATTLGGKHDTEEFQNIATTAAAAFPTVPSNIRQIFKKAWRKALGGGVPGAVAGVIQVLLLMWLRTVINYQSRYGTSFFRALSILYNEGGIPRFYRGLGFALFQAPVSRFVATASNDGVLSLLSNLPASRHWNPGFKTFFASFVVGIARIAMMPIDTAKTVLQVDSVDGFRSLMKRVKQGDYGALYQGAWATALSSSLGHYPWFTTYNALSSSLWLEEMVPSKLLRNAVIGCISSIVSDTAVNVFRVIKTTKQSLGAKHNLSYGDTIRMIVASDGVKGLFGRGLQTRIFANALQSILFTVIWRGLAERWGGGKNAKSGSTSTSSTRTTKKTAAGDTTGDVDDDHHPPPHQVHLRK